MKTKQIATIQTAKYATEYSDSMFWIKAKALTKEAGYQLIYRALLLYYVLTSPNVPWEQKLIVTSALGYLICPVDLIPDFVPVAGYTDDFAALEAAITAIKANLTPKIEEQARAKASSLLFNK